MFQLKISWSVYDPTTTVYRLDGVIKTMAQYTSGFAWIRLYTFVNKLPHRSRK